MAYNFTQQQAQAYYNTLPPAEKARVDAAGGPSVEWLTNAVGAGVPDAIRAVGGTAGAAEGGWEGEGGYTLDPSGAADASEWLGKRMPTAQELRKWAQAQHAQYVSGNTSAQDEDYARYTDRQLADWINRGWDANAGGWKAGFNAAGEASNAMPGGGGGGGGDWGGGGGGGGSSTVSTPDWNLQPFKAPTYEEAINSPGFQFRLNQGTDALERSAAAKGLLRTGGTLKDIVNFGQQAAADEYQNVFNRSLAGWQANYQPWQQMFQAGENRWQTRYGGDLSKYLQRENNIYGLLNQPPPTGPQFY